MTTVGLVSPGEMGSALAADLGLSGVPVVGTLAGRSRATALRAARAGITVLDDLESVVRASDVVLSVVPPQDAVGVMRQLVATAHRLGVHPVLADLNAVTPAAVRSMAAAADLDVVDGSLLGGPPDPARPPTRLLLSGDLAHRVAELPWQRVEVHVIGPTPGMASAAKMCTGAVRKGTTALVVNALATAAQHGVEAVVESELRRALGRDPLVEVELAAAKAWRFVPEMQSVALTQAEAGLDPTLYEAVVDVFERLAASPLAGRHAEDISRETGDLATRLARIVRGMNPSARPSGSIQAIGPGADPEAAGRSSSAQPISGEADTNSTPPVATSNGIDSTGHGQQP